MRIKTLLICVGMLTMVAPSFASQPPEGAPPADDGHRGDLLDELELAKIAFAADRSDSARYEYAHLLFESGSFEEARSTVETLISAPEPSLDASYLAGRLAYLMGDYEEAERLYLDVLERESTDTRALKGLVFTYYQTNRFERCAKLAMQEAETMRLPHLALMKEFGERRPYAVEWTDPRATEVPFVSMDPLPVIEVEIDGRKIAALIDTGADLFILDTQIAEELGIDPVASMMGMFAGGKQAEIGFAEAASLKLGGVEMRRVPISLLPTKPLSLGEVEIGGIVGTSVLRQFLSTLDYPNERLVLRERGPEESRELPDVLGERVVAEVPFYLEGTHSVLAHGSLNGYDGMLFHVDSGLAGVPSFAAAEQTLQYVGIPIPEVAVREGVIGGAGGGFAVGEFEIAKLGLGGLEQPDLVGSFGGRPPGSYRRFGFIMDGLISHNFLRQYAWTLDFDRMTMVFTE